MTAAAPDPAVALVVEDDELIGQLLKFMLERNGYRVRLAADGRVAAGCITGEPPPAIALFDVMLPYMDGFQLVALARDQAGWRAVPILMLTAKAQERDIARALEAGADDYMLKPFDPQALLGKVQALRAAAR